MNTYLLLWSKMEQRLDVGLSQWRKRLIQFNQVPAIEAREQGRKWSDNEIFKGLVLSVLSNSTDWAKVERVLPELDELFHGFEIHWYARLSEVYITDTVAPWFRARRASSMPLRKNCIGLISAAQQLLARAEKHGAIDQYLKSLVERRQHDTIAVAVALGSTASSEKLPTLGIPLAAEFLKNVGYDIAKPDRHITRALGCFGMVDFQKWPDRSGTKAPIASTLELVTVMRVMEQVAQQLGMRTAFVDNALWMLCAQSGLYLTNERLSRMALLA